MYMLDEQTAKEVIDCHNCGTTQEVEISFRGSYLHCYHCGENLQEDLEECGYIFE